MKKRKRRCLGCNQPFRPHRHVNDKQRYCANPTCQKKRQRLNEKVWLLRNPACLVVKRRKTKDWFQTHPDYSRKRRRDHPEVCQQNRIWTRLRMRELRRVQLFDKTKSILTQLVQSKGDKCYLTRGFRWLHIRLANPSQWSRGKVLWENAARLKPPVTVLASTRAYDVTETVFCRSP